MTAARSWARRFQTLSLRRQLRLALAAGCVLALLVASLTTLALESRRMQRVLDEELKSTGSLVANRSSAALAFGDEATADENLRAIQYLDYVGHACLLDDKGRILARYLRAGFTGNPCEAQAGEAGVLRLSVEAGGQRVGELLLRAVPGTVQRRLAPTLWTLAFALLLALVAGMVFTAPLQRWISTPLERIRQVANRVIESGDFALRAPPLGGNELGRLSSAFNRMLDTISAQNQSLAAREHYARALFSSSHLAQLVLEPGSGRIRDANPASAEVLGLNDPAALPGRCFAELLAPEQAWDPDFLARLLLDLPAERALHMRHQEGSRHWDCVARFLRVELQGEDLVHCSLEDVTERLAAERAIRAANEALEMRVQERTQDLAHTIERLNATRDQLVSAEKQVALARLVAGMAHEINTPVGNARLAVSTLQNAGEDLGKRLAQGLRRSDLNDLLHQLREGTDLAERNLARVVELISTFKQVSADQASSERREFRLDKVVQDVLQVMAPQLRRSPVQIELALDQDLRMFSHAGPLEQVLVNLIQNALMHGLEGREDGCIRIEAARAAPGDQLRLAIEDNGCGMPPAVLARIFDPFFTTKMGRGGLGLGLAIVQGLVTQLLGGQLSVRSQPGQGTRFELLLPAQAPQAEPPA